MNNLPNIKENFNLYIFPTDLKFVSNNFNISIEEVFFFIKNFILDISELYPNFESWIDQKVVPSILNSSDRKIILLTLKENQKFNIVGISILKDSFNEKKICTLSVNKNYRNLGIATFLFEESFKILNTRKPFLTISEDNYDLFLPIIKKFDFKITSIKKDIYKQEKKEYYLNE